MVESARSAKRPWKYSSALVLIAANLIPLAGVLFLGWSAFELVFVYWMETGIIGVFNVAKMVTYAFWGNPAAEVGIPQHMQPKGGMLIGDNIVILGITARFMFFYGGYLYVLGSILLWVISPEPLPVVGGKLEAAGCILRETMSGDRWLALLAFVASHGFSFWDNFIRRREYRKVTAKELHDSPFARVLMIAVAIVGGAALSKNLEEFLMPTAVLTVLVLLKMGLDVKLHLKEHETGVLRLWPRKNKR